MGMNIKSDQAHAMARQLAHLDNTTVTEAVTAALREALDARQGRVVEKIARAHATLERMRAELAASPDPSLREVSDALYDDRGLPR